MNRDLTLTIEPVTGTHNFFVVKVNDEVVIYAPADTKREYKGSIPEKLTKIFVSSLGVGSGPKYQVDIDLPGNTSDHNNTYTLDRGYHEITYIL